MADGYTLGQIEYLERQRHLAPYRRDAEWRHALTNAAGEVVSIGPLQPKFDARLDKAITIAKTARTIMRDRISEWAGNLDEDELQKALPYIWNGFIQEVRGEDEPAKEADEALEPEEVEPVQVIARPDVDFDNMPKSEVVAPDQISLGDILGKIATDNSKD